MGIIRPMSHALKLAGPGHDNNDSTNFLIFIVDMSLAFFMAMTFILNLSERNRRVFLTSSLGNSFHQIDMFN